MGNPLVVQPGPPCLPRGHNRSPSLAAMMTIYFGMEEKKAGWVGDRDVLLEFSPSFPQPCKCIKAKEPFGIRD